MFSFRNILIVVTILSFLSIAGMKEIRASLALVILIMNICLWTLPRIEKWRKERNAHVTEGERQLGVGNYAEAERELILAAAEAEDRASSVAARAAIRRNLAEAQRKQSKFAEAKDSALQAIALTSGAKGQSRSEYAHALE